MVDDICKRQNGVLNWYRDILKKRKYFLFEKFTLCIQKINNAVIRFKIIFKLTFLCIYQMIKTGWYLLIHDKCYLIDQKYHSSLLKDRKYKIDKNLTISKINITCLQVTFIMYARLITCVHLFSLSIEWNKREVKLSNKALNLLGFLLLLF